MNREQLAGIFILAAGMMIGTTAAQSQTQPVQAELGNTGLNSIYAYDDQGNFASIIFTENESRYFGTSGGLSELDPSSSQICLQYVETSDGGFFGDLFNRGSSESVIECQDLTVGNETQVQQVPPLMNQTQENQTQQNQTQQQSETPAAFYAYDEEGEYLNVILSDQGEINSVAGSVSSIDQLNQNSTVACEYFLQENESSSEVNCYDGQELQNRMQNGSITYLPLDQTQQQDNNQSEEQQGDGFDIPFT